MDTDDSRIVVGPVAPARLAVDTPTTREWAAWWATPLPARLYCAVLIGLSLAVSAAAWASQLVEPEVAVTFGGLFLAGMVNVELGRLAEGGRVERQRIHKGLSAWPFATALLLGPGMAGWVAAGVYAHALARGIRIRTWKWIGSWAIVTLAAVAASGVLRLTTGGPLPRDGSVATVGGVLAALAAFLAVEALLLAIISRLNSAEDEVYLRAQLASLDFYAVEASVLATGAVAAVLYRYSPGFVVLALPVYFLLQRGMLHQPLRHEARHDSKTGVLNFEAWRAAAELQLARARREARRAAVVIIDVDHFKSVNDAHGHLVGDDVLVCAADAVVGSLRSSDVAGRFGGDEFCVLLLCDTLGEAAAAGERIRARIAELSPASAESPVTASVGVAIAEPTPTSKVDLTALVAAADQALYEAKTSGRDRVCARVAIEDRPSPARCAGPSTAARRPRV